MGNAVVDAQLHHLGVHHDEADLLGGGLIEQGDNQGVGTHRFTGAGGTGDEQMGQLADIPHNGLSADILAHGKGDLGLAAGKGVGTDDRVDGYRGYQLMIGVSQGVYRIPGIDDQAKQEVSGKFYDMLGNESRARMRFLAEHYADRNSVLAVLPSLRGEENEELVQQVLARLESKNPNYAPLLKYKAEMAEAKAQKERLSEGKVAPEFSFPTPDGKKKLGPQDFKGKILVLDFWASWCGPCRAEIPHLKEAYKEYSNKGVAFFSVSIDKDDAAWRKAMKEENMPWAQAQAPKAGKDVMKQYQFSGIPYILVLDEEGKIVAKNLRGKALTDKLEELLSGKKKSVAMPAMGM